MKNKSNTTAGSGCTKRLVRLSDFEPFFEERVFNNDGMKVINLGDYRESNIQILWTGKEMKLVINGGQILLPSDTLEFLCDFIAASLAGELDHQKIQLDLC